ncbi:MAG: hypothetical protein XD73_1316 [Anaerolinea thermophila]|uniref:NERD domain-containing protein n=1 Tax=Anaerolinea thermophila TaxID=167964 RepID=A0A101FWX8_9CHLR|nr:MAG: hypothetical protein XD73_1316 [Anaerolinea thermophila]
MKQITNDTLIARNKKIGNITSILGIAILIGGLILNIRPDPTRTLLSLGALIVGFVVAQISTSFVTRFGRSPRYDEIIASNLSKLNNEYTFFVYTSPVPMLLTSPHGIWIPVPVSVGGEIYYDGKWRQKGGNVMMKLFGQENLSKPEKDVAAREAQVRKFLEENLGKDSIPPINNILVSLHPKAIIGNVEDAPTPIVEVEALRRTIRKVDRKREEEISPELLNKINDLLKSEK